MVSGGREGFRASPLQVHHPDIRGARIHNHSHAVSVGRDARPTKASRVNRDPLFSTIALDEPERPLETSGDISQRSRLRYGEDSCTPTHTAKHTFEDRDLRAVYLQAVDVERHGSDPLFARME